MTILRPGCKINLGLRITGREPDGYHCLATFFYPLKYPADELKIVASRTGSFEIACNDPGLANNKNLLRKAWEEFGKTTGIWRPYSLRLEKRIPIGSGLGGGSSDAASFLAFLNQDSAMPLADDMLAKVAFSLGADVPFFLLNRPCDASGAGEKLAPAVFRAQGHWLVLVNPGIEASTAKVFRRWDELNPGASGALRCRDNDQCRQDTMAENATHETSLTKTCTPASKTNSASAIDLSNDLEAAAVSLWPELAGLKTALLSLGAENAAMSGSGASFYGIFASRQSAHFAATRLRSQWPRVYCLQLRDFGM